MDDSRLDGGGPSDLPAEAPHQRGGRGGFGDGRSGRTKSGETNYFQTDGFDGPWNGRAMYGSLVEKRLKNQRGTSGAKGEFQERPAYSYLQHPVFMTTEECEASPDSQVSAERWLANGESGESAAMPRNKDFDTGNISWQKNLDRMLRPMWCASRVFFFSSLLFPHTGQALSRLHVCASRAAQARRGALV